MNFPLPEENGPACLVKMYDEDGNYKVTDMLEVYGVLSVDPALAQLASSSDEGQGDVSTFGSMELQEEVAAHSPPPSLVPRIHVVHAVRLQHSHPLITDPPTSAGEQAVVQSILSDALRIRENFIGCLSHILMGDAMAAEYLFLHLLSGVYARKDMVALGKFSLNLSGCPDSVLTQKIYELINAVTPKVSQGNDERYIQCSGYWSLCSLCFEPLESLFLRFITANKGIQFFQLSTVIN
eukprot:m.221322 g.221322  ORF g.221322 m.221322 type:complete len:238 (+) comp39959_c0_seq16:708-1421(+)